MVIIAKRIHLFPFRTQKLSSLAPMVLGGKLPGRGGRSRVIFFIYYEKDYIFINPYTYLLLKILKGGRLNEI